jgi:integrase
MKNSKFFLRKQGKGSPVIVFHLFDSRFKGRKFMYSTGFHCVGDWDKRRERTKDLVINSHLDFIQSVAKDFLDTRVNSRTLSRQDLKQYILSRQKDEIREREERELAEQDKHEVFQLWEEIIQTSKNSKGEPTGHDTKRQKRQTLKKVKTYCKETKFTPTLLNMDMRFYHAFDTWMISQGIGPNTRGKNFKEIKAFLREAAERDIPVTQAYLKKSWKIIDKPTDSVFLTILEIQKILQIQDLTPAKQRLRDLFVIACFTGARHSDWKQIRKENIVTENKREILRYKQAKTGEVVHVPLHPVVKTLLNKYTSIPVPVGQKCNEGLKEIMEKAELGKCTLNGKIIDKHTVISTHTARRSFATNAYLSRSMDTQQIMKCTGHKTESSFLRYLKLDGRDFAVLAAESKFFTEDLTVLKIA